MLLLSGWVSYVVICQEYAIEVVSECVRVYLGGLFGFNGN